MKQRLAILLIVIFVGILPILLSGTNLFGGGLPALPPRSLLLHEQQAQAMAGLVIKPTYMLLSLLLILALIGETSLDLAALQWGQIAFLTGETFCAINFYIYRHASVLSEYLHSYGMALAFALTIFAMLEGLDARLLHLNTSQTACAALPICGKCTRHAEAGCNARILARWLVPMLAALAVLPLTAPLQPDAYAVTIFGFPYSYVRLDFYETYERRILPGLAMLSFITATLPLFQKNENPIPAWTKILVSLGLGALGFSFFRLALNAIFASNLTWFEFWEETTEFMFIGALIIILWQFRATLLGKSWLMKQINL